MVVKDRKFSVIIPLYNREHTIGRALESVFGQTYQSYDVIVVDDGSTDSGWSIVESFTDYRLSLERQANSGVSVARNLGIAKATNPYVVFLDADDTWEPEYLKHLNDLINRFPGMGAYSTGYYLKYPGRSPVKASIFGVPVDKSGGVIGDYYKSAASGSNPLWTGATCIPKSVLTEMGGFPEGVRLHEDLYLWARIAIKYQIALSPVPLATYYKFEEDGTCVNSVVEEKDFLFFNFLGDLIDGRNLDHESHFYARRYLNQWLVKDAVKAAAVSNAQMTKSCLELLRPTSAFDKVRLGAIGLYLRIPSSIQRRIRVFGRGLKSYFRNLKFNYIPGGR